MRNSVAALALALLLIGAPLAGTAETVRSLDRIPPLLKTPEARGYFADQMQGKPAPDGLGVHLPPALSGEAIARLLTPAESNEPVRLVGAKPWQGPDRYVAIVCTGGEGPPNPDDKRCASGDDSTLAWNVYLGVIATKDGKPSLVASSGPVACRADWSKSGLPAQPVAADDAKGPISPERFERFDLASYQIAPGRLAFGIRGAWMESYAGGGAYYTSLCLFEVDGAKLKQILSVPMSAFLNTAGDWNKDGTRQHDISEGANVLIVSRTTTQGRNDLTLKSRSGRWQRVFRWSEKAGAYRAQ